MNSTGVEEIPSLCIQCPDVVLRGCKKEELGSPTGRGVGQRFCIKLHSTYESV